MAEHNTDEFQLTVARGTDYARRSFEMRESILRDIRGTERECWYICDETEEEFYAFFSDAESTPIGALASDGAFAAIGVGSYRKVELERFRAHLPEGVIESRKAAYIELIQVDSRFRGRGLQRRLFQEFERRYVEQGVEFLTAIVSPHNYPSLNNFLKEGYKEVGRFVHRETGFERLLMLKRV